MPSRLSLFLLLPLVACGGSDPQNTPGPDSSITADAGIDGTEPPQMGVASVVVTRVPQFGAPVQYAVDTPVVFYKPDGTVLTTVKTDAMGRASATIERGAFATIVLNEVYVEAARIEPGQTLHFGADVTPTEPNGSLQISWPSRVFTGYTTYYYVYTSCGYSGETTSTSATIPVTKACSTGPIDVVVTSRRSSQGVTGAMSRRNVQATGGVVNVNLADNGGTWEPSPSGLVQLVNSPNANMPSPSTSCTGVQYLGSLAFNSTGASESSGYCAMRLLNAPQSVWSVQAEYDRNNDGHYTLQMRQTLTQAGPLDGTGSLPWITSFGYAPATRTITWNAEADADLDVSSVTISVENPYRVWHIVAPKGLPKTFKIPALPAAYAMVDLKPTDTARANIVNIDYVGATADDVVQGILDERVEDSFIDKARRGATANNY